MCWFWYIPYTRRPKTSEGTIISTEYYREKKNQDEIVLKSELYVNA